MDQYEPKLCDDGKHRVTRTDLRRHMYAIFRFIDRTDEVITITYKGKDDLVLMSVKRYSRLIGIDIEARIREGKELPTHDEILASVRDQELRNILSQTTPGEVVASMEKERVLDELATKGELPEDERVFRESRAGKQWRIALDTVKAELDAAEQERDNDAESPKG